MNVNKGISIPLSNKAFYFLKSYYLSQPSMHSHLSKNNYFHIQILVFNKNVKACKYKFFS